MTENKLNDPLREMTNPSALAAVGAPAGPLFVSEIGYAGYRGTGKTECCQNCKFVGPDQTCTNKANQSIAKDKYDIRTISIDPTGICSQFRKR